MRRALFVLSITAGTLGFVQANAATPDALVQVQEAQEKLRKVCVNPAFLACMRWDQQGCAQRVNDAIVTGNRRAAPQVEKFMAKHHQQPEKASAFAHGMYWGATLGELLKSSGMRLNNCLPDPKTL